MLHGDDRQYWRYPCDRQMSIGCLIEATSPACRVNRISARQKLSSINALFLLGDRSPKGEWLSTQGRKIQSLGRQRRISNGSRILINLLSESLSNRKPDVVQHMIPLSLTLEGANGICTKPHKRSGSPAVSLCFRQPALNFITLKDLPQPRILIDNSIKYLATVCSSSQAATAGCNYTTLVRRAGSTRQICQQSGGLYAAAGRGHGRTTFPISHEALDEL